MAQREEKEVTGIYKMYMNAHRCLALLDIFSRRDISQLAIKRQKFKVKVKVDSDLKIGKVEC